MPPRRTPAEKAFLRLLGDRIKERRLELALTQEAVGQLSGRHPTYVGGIERGERNPTVLILAHIAEALDVDVAMLFDEAPRQG